MKMMDPVPQFTHLVSSLKSAHPDLAYIHVVDPIIYGDRTSSPETVGKHESNDFLRAVWSPRPLISAGGYTRESAIKAADATGDLIAFGRQYISNVRRCRHVLLLLGAKYLSCAQPDLPSRLERNIPLTPYDRNTFYIPIDAEGTEVGYIDYLFAATAGQPGIEVSA